MDSGGNLGETATYKLSAGTILVWDVPSERAADMAIAVQELGFGSWSINPIGLGGRTCYFDVILDREASELELLLALGSQPQVY